MNNYAAGKSKKIMLKGFRDAMQEAANARGDESIPKAVRVSDN